MDVMVGCPVYRRDWILPKWFEFTEAAFSEVGITPTYVFVVDVRDELTHACLVAHADMYEREVIIRPIEEDIKREERREWDAARILHMVGLRNELLSAVRERKPEHFLSLDSDILLSSSSLAGMYENIDDFDAVGGKVYLSKSGTRCASYAKVVKGRMIRASDIEYVKEVGAIMAVKLMTPAAYNVDYKYHYSGEDIGWSIAAKEAGLRLGFDGRYTSKHIWEERFLDVYDRRVGY